MTTVQLPPDYALTIRRIATRFRAARHHLGLTQEQLAERAGVHRNTIQNLEADRCDSTPTFRLDVVLAVTHALGLSHDDLFG